MIDKPETLAFFWGITSEQVVDLATVVVSVVILLVIIHVVWKYL